MGQNVCFKQLKNLTTNEDLLKKLGPKLRIVSVGDRTLELEMAISPISIGSSLLLQFSLVSGNSVVDLDMTCKVNEVEEFRKNVKVSLRLSQYNKKYWALFLKHLEVKQDRAQALLVDMRGRSNG